MYDLYTRHYMSRDRVTVFTFIVDQHFSFPTKPMLLPLTSVPDYSSFPSDEICFDMQNKLSKNAVIVKHTEN